MSNVTDLCLDGFSLGILPPRIAMGLRIGRGTTVRHIQEVVADFYGIPEAEMRSDRRSREVAWPRQVAMYLARELTPKSLPSIGRFFGGRDHTTVIHAIKAVTLRLALDAEQMEDMAALRDRLAA